MRIALERDFQLPVRWTEGRSRNTLENAVETRRILAADGIDSIEGDAAAGLRAQVPKRVAIHFHPVKTATWDHRKLGGTY